MILELGMILVGLVLLFLGGEWIVLSSMAIAHKARVSPLIVSVVVIGFSTSTPELLVSVQAVLKGAPDIALGNIVGSNIANVLLILGLGSLICAIPCHQREVRRETIAVILASMLLAGLSLTGVVSRIFGGVFIIFLLTHMIYSIWTAKKYFLNGSTTVHDLEDAVCVLSFQKAIPLAVGSIVALIVGAKMLVEGAIFFARDFGISESVIGLTIIAVGTSLPEMAAAIAAARKGKTDVIVGNVLGSNMFNILGILGITALFAPVTFAAHIAHVDVWVMLAVALTLVPLVFFVKKISRTTGFIYLGLYATYIAWLGAGLGS